MEAPTTFRYRAFLSYSHRDEAWAKWLHRSLESYRIDKDLVRRETPAGRIPESLRPVFRDRDEFSAGHSLSEQTSAALQSSQFIVVLCSPSATRSAYVTEEIRRFKQLGGRNRVIAVIVDGEPGDPDRECFPETLRFKVDTAGNLTAEREEPIAADAREQGDGKNIALQKVVAGLLGVGLDEIVRRAEKERRRQARGRRGIAASIAVLILIAAGAFLWARHELSRSETLLDRTLERATGLVGEATTRSDRLGLPRTLSLRFLEQAEGLFKDMAELGRETSLLRYRKAWMATEFARNFALLGNSEAQRLRAVEAQTLMHGLVEAEPANLAFHRDLAITYSELGHAFKEQGRFQEALDSYRSGLEIFARLVRSNPQDADGQHALSVLHDHVGELLMAHGNLEAALKAFYVRHEMISRLAAADPGRTAWQRDLSASFNKVGELYKYKGSLSEALKHFKDGLAIRERLSQSNPQDANYQFSIGISHERIGDVLLEQGALGAAMQSYRARHDIISRLAIVDPSNALWQRDMSASHSKLGDVFKAQIKWTEALNEYRISLAIAKRLSESDPRNVNWRHDLGIRHERLGDLMMAQGDWAGAQAEYAVRHEIISQLVKGAPSHVIWQHNLSVSHEKLGDLYKARKDYANSLRFHRTSLAIRRALSGANPANATLLRDISIAHDKIGDVLLMRDDLQGALQSFKASLDLRWRLAVSDPTNARWQLDLAGIYNNLCWAHALIGNLTLALATCNESLRIQPRDANTYGSRGLVFLKSKVFDDALADFEEAVRLDPRVAYSLYGLGVAERKLGREEAGNSHIAAAKAIQPDIAVEFSRYGID